MRIASINGGVFGSTGKIMFGIADVAEENGMETRCFSPITGPNRFEQPRHAYTKIGSYRGRQFSTLASRITGRIGGYSFIATKKLLKDLNDFKPDIIHLHNLHDSYVNLLQLFSYIKEHDIAVVWTLHDCWPFTGHCPYYSIAKCEKWKTECNHCPIYRQYPQSFFDNSKKMFRLKKKWFGGVRNMTLVTVSQWLGNEVKQSFLNQYPIKVINNGIDLNVFKYTESDFKEKYGISDKTMILGVAMPWSKRKGIGDFIELSKRLDANRYQIVLVGTDEECDKLLPSNIISIHRTQDQTELAKIYSAADVFVNPSREETMGLVTVEAIACGTPAITYDETAVPEKITRENGIVVKVGDINAMIEAIPKAIALDRSNIAQTVSGLNYGNKYQEYIDLYKEILNV